MNTYLFVFGWLVCALATVMFFYASKVDEDLRFYALVLVVIGAGLLMKSKQ